MRSRYSVHKSITTGRWYVFGYRGYRFPYGITETVFSASTWPEAMNYANAAIRRDSQREEKV